MKLTAKLLESFMGQQPEEQLMLNDLVNRSLWMVTQYHIWHLQTKEYAEHMAIGDFYEGLNEKLDSIAEHFIGTGGNISVSEGQEFSNYSKSNVLGRLEEFGEFVNMVNNSLEGKNQLKVVLDEIEGCVSQTLYKLGLK